MRRICEVALLVILCVVIKPMAQAVCAGTSVNAFGASGDGASADTTAIQSAINAAAANGGGSVVFNVARYFTMRCDCQVRSAAGHLTVMNMI